MTPASSISAITRIDPLHFEHSSGSASYTLAAGAEVPRLTGESEQVILPAGIAIDACEAVMGIAALQEALDRALFHRAAKAARFAKLLAVAPCAAPQRARARVARAVDPAVRRLSRVPCAALAAW